MAGHVLGPQPRHAIGLTSPTEITQPKPTDDLESFPACQNTSTLLVVLIELANCGHRRAGQFGKSAYIRRYILA